MRAEMTTSDLRRPGHPPAHQPARYPGQRPLVLLGRLVLAAALLLPGSLSAQLNPQALNSGQAGQAGALGGMSSAQQQMLLQQQQQLQSTVGQAGASGALPSLLGNNDPISTSRLGSATAAEGG